MSTRRPTLRDRLEIADGCLDMIREELVRLLGESGMKGTPAMMYPEAIRHAVALAARGKLNDRVGPGKNLHDSSHDWPF